MVSIIDQYNDELKEHLLIDELNLKDAQMLLPGRKHLWVGRLMRHKQQLNNLKKLKKETLERITKKIQEASSVRLSIPAAEKAAWTSQPIKDINLKIEEEEILIEFLEKVEKIFGGMSYDIKNIIEIQKLETL